MTGYLVISSQTRGPHWGAIVPRKECMKQSSRDTVQWARWPLLNSLSCHREAKLCLPAAIRHSDTPSPACWTCREWRAMGSFCSLSDWVRPKDCSYRHSISCWYTHGGVRIPPYAQRDLPYIMNGLKPDIGHHMGLHSRSIRGSRPDWFMLSSSCNLIS